MKSIACKSTSVRTSRRLALVTVAMPGTLIGCTQSPPKPISAAESKLELRVPAFENGEISFTREDEGSSIIEIGRWKAADGLATAVLMLNQFKPHASGTLGFVRTRPEEMINAFFREGSVTLGAKMTYSVALRCEAGTVVRRSIEG